MRAAGGAAVVLTGPFFPLGQGKSGVVAHLMDRDRALGKLQLSLKDFRKLCILKGIYPRVPPAAIKKKNKTYYHTKDIMFLYHDPIIAQIRKYKTYRKRIRKVPTAAT